MTTQRNDNEDVAFRSTTYSNEESSDPDAQISGTNSHFPVRTTSREPMANQHEHEIVFSECELEQLSAVHEEDSNESENLIGHTSSVQQVSSNWSNEPGTTTSFPPAVQNNYRTTSAGSTSSSSSLRPSLATRFFSATTKKIHFYRGSSNTSESDHSDQRLSTHLKRLHRERMRQEKFIQKSVRNLKTSDTNDMVTSSVDESYGSSIDGQLLRKSEVNEHTKDMTNKMRQMKILFREWEEGLIGFESKFEIPLEVRMHKFSYSVLIKPGAEKIKTVYNSSFLYGLKRLYKKYWLHEVETTNEEPVTKVILDDINLVLQPGKSYLVLGPPQSGKTSLLRAISGRIRPSKRKRQNRKQAITGQVLYNGRSLEEGGEEFHIQNAVQYIDQLDRHAPRLTVRETFEFAFQCKSGGKILRETEWCNENQLEILRKYDREGTRVKSSLIGLGLDEVCDTFVGDTNIRGISGGQRRRVTVGEMLQERIPVLCGDEISTGLDAGSTFEMVELLVQFKSVNSMTRVISLLQPSPEVSNLVPTLSSMMGIGAFGVHWLFWNIFC